MRYVRPDREKEGRLLCRAIIKQIIKDLGGSDMATTALATASLETRIFSSYCEKAGYPQELLDSLKEMLLLSEAQRKATAVKIIEALNELPK